MAVVSMILNHNNDEQGFGMFPSPCSCLTKTTSCASGSEKLLAMYQKSPPKVLY